MKIEIAIPTHVSGMKVEEKIDFLINALAQQLILLNEVLNGKIHFGDRVDPDNMAGVWVSTTTGPTPGTDFAVDHNLGVIPAGFILMVPPRSGVINGGITPWSTTQIFLKSTVAGEDFTIFVLPPPKQEV